MNGSQRGQGSDTRSRLLEATEGLFLEHGYDAMSLRQITARAGANLAAVNYHFGSKEALMRELLSHRLDRLNFERLRLLSSCEKSAATPPDASTILGILFAPALRISRDGVGGRSFMRLLGRVYSDPSTFIREHLQEHYRPIFGRFFDAFSRALPALSRNELGLRLHFCLKALAGMLAGEDMDDLIADLSMGEHINDSELLARLISLISPTLTSPFGSPAQIRVIDDLLSMADEASVAVAQESASVQNDGHPRRRKSRGVLNLLHDARSSS